jgi:hypothetical protein
MSVYAFGKLIDPDLSALEPALLSAARSSKAVIRVGVIDEDDDEAMSRVQSLSRTGLVFSIGSGPEEHDVVVLWNEAMKALRYASSSAVEDPDELSQETFHCFLQTRLGSLCDGVLRLGEVAAVALVDGGIEQVFEGQLEQCLRQMAVDVRHPWDQSKNRLYLRKARS